MPRGKDSTELLSSMMKEEPRMGVEGELGGRRGGEPKPGCACIAVTSAVPPVLTGPIKD